MRIRTKTTSGELSVSHRERLIEELRSEPQLAAAYLRAVSEEGDPRIYLTALRTVARALP
jgi:DNA-binding phage protein